MAVIRDIIRESVRLDTLSGAELSRGRFTVTPVARSLTIGRLPAGALEGDGAVFFRWIWPSAVLVTEDGQTSRVPIVDVTKRAQTAIALGAMVLLCGICMRTRARKER